MNEHTIARKIIQHMESAHGMKVIPADFMMKIKYAIRDNTPVQQVNSEIVLKTPVMAMR